MNASRFKCHRRLHHACSFRIRLYGNPLDLEPGVWSGGLLLDEMDWCVGVDAQVDLTADNEADANNSANDI